MGRGGGVRRDCCRRAGCPVPSLILSRLVGRHLRGRRHRPGHAARSENVPYHPPALGGGNEKGIPYETLSVCVFLHSDRCPLGMYATHVCDIAQQYAILDCPYPIRTVL